MGVPFSSSLASESSSFSTDGQRRVCKLTRAVRGVTVTVCANRWRAGDRDRSSLSKSGKSVGTAVAARLGSWPEKPDPPQHERGLEAGPGERSRGPGAEQDSLE